MSETGASTPRTKGAIHPGFAVALVLTSLGVCFSDACVTPSGQMAAVVVEPQESDGAGTPTADTDETKTGDVEPIDVPITRIPPWVPPEELLLEGVDGAGQLLARGDAKGALERLSSLNKLDVEPGEADLQPESREWFRAGAIAGRAYLRTGQVQQAVLSLEPLAASKAFAKELPRDIVGYELALARVDWATSGELDPATADIQLKKAISELDGLKKTKPDRMQSAMRALQGRAMAAIQGSDERDRKAAGKKAITALDRLITSFPNHPEVGEWMLDEALTKERAGEAREAAEALRQVAIDRAGEPEAARAWAQYERLASEHEDIAVRELTTEEQLAAGQAARVLRRLERSRELLEGVWTDATQPRHRHREAGFSLAWTYYKNKDYGLCADVLGELYAEVRSIATRGDLSRCLERAGRYGEMIDLWVEVYDGNKGAYGSTALWNAIEQAVDGGLYQKASDLLAEFEGRYRSHGSERRWLHAWLPLRLGDREAARVAFTEMVDSGRTSGHERAAVYFLGKLELGHEDRTIHLQGVRRLQELAGEASSRMTATGVIGGNPIYYGLMARSRLLEAGEDPGPDPVLAPLDWEERWIGHAETLDLLHTAANRYGEAFSSLDRADQLLAIGWREEASRELRVASDEFINGRSVYDGSDMPGTRSEALVAGLSWAAEWRHPQALPSRDARKAMRDEQTRADMRELFMALDWAMQEPYRFAKLTDPGEPYRSRWHIRPYREAIERHAWAREVDPHHLWALMYTESRFRRHVVSHVGARGALQIMPWTGRQLVELDGELEPGARFDPDILFEIEDNSRLAAFYISELLRKFHGQATFAYASYNGGPSNVARWLEGKARGPTGVGLDEYVEEIPFSETAKYARRVMEVHATYELLYRGKLPQWSNEVDPVFEDNIDF
ncbi:MAG: lytic transglycosylase domain-containing protein [Myxococcales bacterium]|nr:lytic transglycosylase domain-containing protein [Myxococcales bacterium]